MTRFDALHIYLDESGDLAGILRERALALVGGVLLFGACDSADDDALRALLEKRLREAGGVFPLDLHSSRTSLTPARQEQFIRTVAPDLQGWCGSSRELHGISIEYEQDLFAAGPALLTERSYDNRYLFMLHALVEHLLFVDNRTQARLNPGARVCLHFANRAYKFEVDEIAPDDLAALGWTVYDDRQRPGKFFVPSSLRAGEVRVALQQGLRQRWRSASVVIDRIEVTRIDYEGNNSPAPLYLADLYLGQVRQQLLGNQRQRVPVLLDCFCQLRYGPALDRQARLKAAVESGDVAQYVALASQSAEETLTDDLVDRAAQLLAATPQQALGLLAEACQEADKPGLAQLGLRKGRTVVQMLRRIGKFDLRTEVMELQLKLSHANHTGDVERAASLWNDYLLLEPRLGELGLEGLRLYAVLRRRRAVNLIDRFEYEEAERVLTQVASAQEDLRPIMASRFGVELTAIKDRELAACHGTLGQLYSFRGTPAHQALAVHCFERAMPLFIQPMDIERQWVYLGHLACDQGEAGAPLWERVRERLPELGQETPIARSDGQYLLALQLKGLYVFGPIERVRTLLASWEAGEPLEQYAPEVRPMHPFGVIRQALALNSTRLWREAGRGEKDAERAKRFFDAAYEHFLQGGSLLQVLGYLCKLRRHLFALEVSPGSANPRQMLLKTIARLKAQLLEEFGDAAWHEFEDGRASGWFGRRDPGSGVPVTERAAALLQAVRFNYW